MLQTQNPYSRERIDALTTMLAGMDARGRQAYATQHRNDPAVVATAVHVNNTVKAAERAKAMQAAGPMPTVVDQNIAAMSPAPAPVAQTQLPENQGIAQIPTPNMQTLADGGIAGYEDDEEGMATGGMGGMFNFAQQSEPVVRMAGGGMTGYMPGFKNTGAVNAAFEAALEKTLKYEGGYVKDDAGKGESNFGINKSANPDVDVKNLTKEKARELYKKRYWDAIGGDALAAKNPALATVAFDTAVNMGVGKANQLVAKAKDDPSTLLGLRQQHYDSLVKDNPEKFAPYAKGWKARVADLATSVIPSAQAAELPQPTQAAAPAKTQPEKAGLESTDAGSNVLKGMVAGNVGINALQAGKDVLNAGFKPGTTAGQAGRVLGTAAIVPQAVMAGGVGATKKAMSDLQYMSEDQRRALAANPMLSAMSGDAGLAGAIMDAAANNPEGPSKMPYSQQMANVGKTILQHPDIDRMREANKAKTEKAKVASYDPNNMVPISPDEFGSAVGIPEPALPKPEEKAVVEAAKEATPAKERKGFNNDDLLTLGLSLLASKSPNFMTALGEAGLATVAGKKEREKIEREESKLKGSEELQKAQAKYYGAYAGAIERGAKEKNDELEAEKLVRQYMGDWEKNNKIANIQDPTARLQEESRIRQQIYASLGLTPIMSKQAGSASQPDPLGILNKR
jgi:lysozyme family protein